MMPELMQQLAALKTATINFDCLHEAQVLQLKTYPALVTGVKQPWTVSVDPERKTCTYKCTGKKLKNTLANMEMVSGYVKKFILWDATTVQFFLNDQLMFDSRNK
jgi:hypothetical protein